MSLTPMPSGQPFIFKTQFSLVQLTEWRAADIQQLRDGLEKIPETSVYYHTHHFLQQHQSLVQEPPNDFAYWVTHILNESKIGERLAAVDTVAFYSLQDLRAALLEALGPRASSEEMLRTAPAGQEFHFMKSILFDLETPYKASDLGEFAHGLRNISIQSLYFHMFESRLRSSQRMNDFSAWLGTIGEMTLSREIARLDPYSHTMEELRSRILTLIEKKAVGATHVPIK